jgi:hypothetical protein
MTGLVLGIIGLIIFVLLILLLFALIHGATSNFGQQ